MNSRAFFVKWAASNVLEQNEKFPRADTNHDVDRAFNMTYQNREGVVDYPYLTSWGFTTRSLGDLIMTQ